MNEKVFKNLQKIITSILKSNINNVISIYIFGSLVKGHYRSDSDVDIAFLSHEKVENLDIWQLSNILSNQLGRNVDLIDLQNADTVLKAQIVSSGICIYVSDVYKKEEFEMYALSFYSRLNEERKAILDRIEKGGTIYG